MEFYEYIFFNEIGYNLIDLNYIFPLKSSLFKISIAVESYKKNY